MAFDAAQYSEGGGTSKSHHIHPALNSLFTRHATLFSQSLASYLYISVGVLQVQDTLCCTASGGLKLMRVECFPAVDPQG